VTHARYNCLSDFVFNSHSLFISLKSECNVLMTAIIFVCTCILKLSFRFSQTSSHCMQIFDFTTVSLSSIIVWLNVTLWLSKWINSNFELSNCTAFSFAHVNAIFVIFSAFSHSCQCFFLWWCSWVTVDFQLLRESLKISVKCKLETKWVK